MTQFKTIPNHTRYEISKSGQVRHRKFKRILKPSIATNGYLQVGVYNDKEQRAISKCIHQFIALTYMHKKPIGHEINFKDTDKNNVSLNNLRYLPLEKNRPRKNPIRYCKACGKKLKRGVKYWCSRKCLWFYVRILVKCDYCNREFYRKKSEIKARNLNSRYTKKRTYCNHTCQNAHRAQIIRERK